MKKIVLITGASSGIGFSFSESALKQNYTVINLSRTAESSFLKKIKSYYAKNTDITRVDQIIEAKKWIVETLKIKKIDVLVNCAGTGYEKGLTAISENDYDKIFNLNVKGLIFTTKIFLPVIRKKSGIICNVSSIAGIKGFSGWSLYCASKYAVEGFSSSIRNELRKSGVRVAVVKPGSVDTPFYKHLPKSVKKDFIKPETIAGIILQIIEMPAEACAEDIFINNSVGDL
ncbi:MAG TPA: SDR family NAD(P)-dependent oxidoreductase [bacterium]|nr:SDR family NAD(P)-dependent oxidoreductase [bacterium]HPN29893.1 SDR family NAD(P)-dependent oxidoreductase [bacterium]